VWRAVIFDLYDTLIDYDDAASRAFSDSVADLIDRPRDEFARVWREGRPLRETGQLAPYLRTLGLDTTQVREVTARRLDWTRKLVSRPRPGAIETLRRLRARGLATGLITVCSEDLALIWDQTPLAPLIDVAVFSSSVGLRKPDPQIYRLACARLEIEPQAAIFVGDGANDELAGAERVGMRAIMIHREGDEAAEQRFAGARITQLSQLTALLD
jgi:putative hydrolase of the HAD superfamily